jgi:hypothetical protein
MNRVTYTVSQLPVVQHAQRGLVANDAAGVIELKVAAVQELLLDLRTRPLPKRYSLLTTPGE